MTFAQPFTDYEILDRVGAGAMGTVFKARHKRLNRIVALKVLKPSLARDSRYVDRLKREARIVASLNHPNIVTGFDLGEEGGYHFFVMEFVEGKSLRGLLAEWGMFAEEYVRRVARAVALALDHAYQRGVIHRDIKPGNILIDEAGNVKLTDMGLAKGPADLTLTRDGATVGTPQYISPEQARNPHDVDVRTDLYSLGATLYHMATGVPPFRGDTMAELITNVLHELPVSPKAINSALSDGMSLVIRKLLAKDLTVRYQTPRALLDDLDRLEKSLPPQIDPARLSEEEGERVRWWPRALLVTGVAALLGVAWLLGLQMRAPVAAAPTASEFLAALDEQLAALPTLGAKLAHLRTISAPPVGSEQDLAARLRSLDVELQRAVDGVAEAFTADGWAQLVAWVREPSVWPDREQVLRERVQPRLLAATGLSLSQLPASVRMVRIEELQRAIDRTLAERDNELVVRFEEFLRTRVPVSAEQSVLADDFARAEGIWRDALTKFCDGVSMPLSERLPEAARRLLRERHLEAHKEAQRTVIDPAEARVDEALRAEAAAACRLFDQQLRGGLAPETVARHLQRFRHDLDQVWPSAKSFRPGRSPWPDLERQFAEVQLAIGAAIARSDDERFAGRCDLVWRTFCHGGADDALALLPDEAPPGTSRAQQLQHHRAALTAARAVELAVAQAIARMNQPAVGFLRAGGAEAVALRAEPVGGTLRLSGTILDQPPREVHLTELRFGELLARLPQDRDPLAALSPVERALGVAVCRLVGDDLAGLGTLVAALGQDDERFLVEEVWPRILRVRTERPDSPLDRRSLFASLRALREAALQSGALGELEKVLAQCTNLVPPNERSNAEEEELRTTKAWLQLAQRRRDLARDLAAAAPRGAEVAVQLGDDELVAEVAMAAPVLQRDAAEGWQLRGSALEFAGGGRPWRDLDQQALRGSAGIEPSASATSLVVDLVLPPATVGRRFWVFEFRGIACVLVMGANDTVHAALVEGDLRREENVQKAFVRAISGVMAPTKATAVPGAVHRLTIDLVATAQRTAALVKVTFEGIELFPPERRALDAQRALAFALHPQQDIAVARVVVRARGL